MEVEHAQEKERLVAMQAVEYQSLVPATHHHPASEQHPPNTQYHHQPDVEIITQVPCLTKFDHCQVEMITKAAALEEVQLPTVLTKYRCVAQARMQTSCGEHYPVRSLSALLSLF